jgi:hypothetical protein
MKLSTKWGTALLEEVELTRGMMDPTGEFHERHHVFKVSFKIESLDKIVERIFSPQIPLGKTKWDCARAKASMHIQHLLDIENYNLKTNEKNPLELDNPRLIKVP